VTIVIAALAGKTVRKVVVVPGKIVNIVASWGPCAPSHKNTASRLSMRYTQGTMVVQSSWCELCRFDDLLLARAVTTSIAAMEFDVRLCPIGLAARGDDETHPGRPPYVVQVSTDHVHDLADVLDEIIDEQQDFDRMLADRRRTVASGRIMTVIAMTGAAELILLLAILDR